ncbi:MAG: class I SAM-dependent methyltransferase [Patescibacteria group bacterium]
MSFENGFIPIENRLKPKIMFESKGEMMAYILKHIAGYQVEELDLPIGDGQTTLSQFLDNAFDRSEWVDPRGFKINIIDNKFEIKKYRDEEKIRRIEQAEAECIDAFSDEEAMNRATKILSRLGLTFDDLEDKKVIDLGSGTQVIERAATIRKAGTVLSIDKRENILSKRPELKNGIVADITKGLPQILDNSIDLLISHGGPPTGFRKKEDIDFCITEILRILKEGGEARISAPVFNFIGQNNKRFRELLAKQRDEKELTNDEKAEIEKIRDAIPGESVKYLQEKGINIVMGKNDLEGCSYGILKK